jgi:glycosyltransferase involved in cell wall biosynthesis
LFPSRYEGFGFPPLEAMACGTPVLSSTLTSLGEAVGDAALPLDPDDPAQIAGQLQRLLESPELREGLVAAGREQAARFTWERCADETIALYERLATQATSH